MKLDKICFSFCHVNLKVLFFKNENDSIYSISQRYNRKNIEKTSAASFKQYIFENGWKIQLTVAINECIICTRKNIEWKNENNSC